MSAATQSLTLLGCGFCFPGPTEPLWPYLPVWVGMFGLWWIFRLKYDIQSRARTTAWLLAPGGIFIVGSLISIGLWTIFLIAWAAYLLLRSRALSRSSPLGAHLQPSDPDAASAWAQLMAASSAQRARAARFHRQTLWILLVALAVKGGLQFSGVKGFF